MSSYIQEGQQQFFRFAFGNLKQCNAINRVKGGSNQDYSYLVVKTSGRPVKQLSE